MPLSRPRNRFSYSQKSYAYTPRSVRRIEKQSKKKLIYAIIFVIIFSFIMLNWGLPAIVGSLSIFNNLKKTEKISSPTDDAAIAPPVLNIPFEATNSAIIRINGYSEANSKVQIYVNDNLATTTNTDSSGNFNIEDLPLELGTNYIYGKTVNENNKTSLGSKKISLIYSDEKPLLEVSEPSDNKEIHGGDKKTLVSGKANPENSLTINGSGVILNGDGTFSREISLNDGENTITIVSSDQIGNNTQVTKKVTYTP